MLISPISSGYVVAFPRDFTSDRDPSDVRREKEAINMLLTRSNPSNSRKITQGEYVGVVASLAKEHPELVLRISEAVSAALFAVTIDNPDVSHRATLFSSDGEQHKVNSDRISGSEIYKRVWTDVIPKEFMEGLEKPIILESSFNSVDQMRTLMDYKGRDHVKLIVDGFSRKRMASLLKESTIDRTRVEKPMTPLDVVKLDKEETPFQEFAKEIEEAARPALSFRLAKQMQERMLYRPLHRLSRCMKFFSRKDFDLEDWYNSL
ncbi:hypothetical protein HOC67_02330 [Candidatus Peregrinibacteria bacterium]|nr:hypothetical protein [Candidatus Peregrinibacteria bacterium]